MRKYIKIEKVKRDEQMLCLKTAIVAQSSTVGEVAVDIVTIGNQEIYHIGSDIGILFSEQKIKQVNDFDLDAMVQKLKQGTPGNFDGFSDEEIMSSIKSRYIQSPADIESYMRNLDEHQNYIKEDIKRKKERAEFKKKYDDALKLRAENEKKVLDSLTSK